MQFLVFVYGSLKEGFGNHALLGDSELVARTQTTKRQFRMISLDAFPAVLKNGHCAIAGEVYSVDLMTMVYLDMLESNGELYKREKVELESGHVAWMYIFMYPMKTPRKNIRVKTENRTQSWELPADGMPEEFRRKVSK